MKAIFAVTLGVALVAGAAHAGTPIGDISGGIAVYYNSATPEVQSNTSYYRAQYNNSTTALNGAKFTFTNPTAAGIFGDVGQFGFDLIVPAPTNTGAPPTLNAWDFLAPGVSNAGPVQWAINHYGNTGGAVASGVTDPNNIAINSVLRGTVGSLNFANLTNLSLGVWKVDMSGTLISDGLIHWYTPSTPDTALSSWGYTNTFNFSGQLTYKYSDDHTPGMDFYAGTVTLEANPIPEPAFFQMGALIGMSGLGLLRLRKRS